MNPPRCKVGDLVYVKGVNPSDPNGGKFATVRQYLGHFDVGNPIKQHDGLNFTAQNYGHFWWIEAASIFNIYLLDSKKTIAKKLAAAWDCSLIPIRDDSGDEDWVTESRENLKPIMKEENHVQNS